MVTKTNEANSIEILLVEDNPGDARLAREVLKRISKSHIILMPIAM